MSTQHPDNVQIPVFAESVELGGEDEIQEAITHSFIEDREHMLNAHNVTKEYLQDKDMAYQRVFLARSAPAMNYGLVRAVLLNKIALQRLHLMGINRSPPKPFQRLRFSLGRLARLQENNDSRLTDGDIIALNDTKVEHPYGKKSPFSVGSLTVRISAMCITPVKN